MIIVRTKVKSIDNIERKNFTQSHWKKIVKELIYYLMGGRERERETHRERG